MAIDRALCACGMYGEKRCTRCGGTHWLQECPDRHGPHLRSGATGTPDASGPTLLNSDWGLPSRKYMSRCAFAGAISRPSIANKVPSWRRMRIKHPPPIPELNPSTTPSVKAVATAASTALPPDLKTFSPASVASGWTEATMPRVPLPGSACPRAEPRIIASIRTIIVNHA